MSPLFELEIEAEITDTFSQNVFTLMNDRVLLE